ncbi:hypothetical protein FQN50_009668 [Emmonsiellopsis sp. PD_5]|nr:hypothetical protein FQN50_009668 [Emmonsiellopsis sp. PD_5]
MRFSLLAFLAVFSPALGKILVDFQAERGDDISDVGKVNLEASRKDKVHANSADVYIRMEEDPEGKPAAHFHRKAGNIRSEIHALSKKTQADKTYTIDYEFSLGAIGDDLMIWQFKEYQANSHGGANIPLALEIKNDKLQLQYQKSADSRREGQWSTKLETNKQYSAKIVINTSTPGWVEFTWNGKAQELGDKRQKRLSATTFPGRAEPKFGAYRGEDSDIDVYVYVIRIEES